MPEWSYSPLAERNGRIRCSLTRDSSSSAAATAWRACGATVRLSVRAARQVRFPWTRGFSPGGSRINVNVVRVGRGRGFRRWSPSHSGDVSPAESVVTRGVTRYRERSSSCGRGARWSRGWRCWLASDRTWMVINESVAWLDAAGVLTPIGAFARERQSVCWHTSPRPSRRWPRGRERRGPSGGVRGGAAL